ncbi:hypothetical protein ACQJBY_032440 [Aegilops geniculata]
MEVLSEQQLVGCDYEVVRGYRRMRMLGSSHCSTDLKLSTRDTCTVTTFIVTTTTGCGAEAGNLSSIGSSLVTKRRFPGRYKHLQLEDISNTSSFPFVVFHPLYIRNANCFQKQKC